MAPRAVAFDLWQTLVRWPREESQRLRERWAARLSVSAERLDELWYEAGAYERREAGPLRPVLEALSTALGGDADVEELLAWRVDLARAALEADAEAIETLDEIRRRGYRLGVVSNCTEDVAIVWPETDLAPRFDAAVFSATAGCLKPDRRIYELALAQLRVPAERCLFVGDGANDELEGALRVGMTPVLFLPGDREPYRADARAWTGARIGSISEILELLP